MTRQEEDLLVEHCSQALGRNAPDIDVLKRLQFRYTCPAREHGAYLPQWLWDSCFHAIVYRWFAPDLAWDELQSLLVHQFSDGADRGMIPHMSHLEENRDRAAQRLFRRKNSSFLTQPPLVSIAFLAVHSKDPRKDILRTIFPKLRAHHDWLDRRRDPRHNGLAAIIHPWESGWDASQRWDEAMDTGTRAVGAEARSSPVTASIDTRALEARRRKLAGLIGAYGCDAAALAGAPGGFYAKPVDFNAIRAADLEALSSIALELGEYWEADELEQRARLARRAIQEKMITEANGILQAHDLIGIDGRPSQVDHAGKFILLFGRCLSDEQAKALAAELSDPSSGYCTGFPVPSVPATNPSFDGDEYWRGNVWLSVNWLIHQGLARYGMADEARRIAERSNELTALHGFQEFFNPQNGNGGTKHGKPCPLNYGWSTIVLDMAHASLSSQGLIPDVKPVCAALRRGSLHGHKPR